MEKKIEVTKTTVECYKIRADKEWTWADINIDANGKTGRIQIASDYGDWQYYWGACGCDFKQFLSQLDIHYMAGKMGAGKCFDIDKTLQLYRENIAEVNPKNSAELFRQCDEMEDHGDKESFMIMLYSKEELFNFFDGIPDMCYKIENGFQQFFDKIWPVLLAEFKKELQPA